MASALGGPLIIRLAARDRPHRIPSVCCVFIMCSLRTFNAPASLVASISTLENPAYGGGKWDRFRAKIDAFGRVKPLGMPARLVSLDIAGRRNRDKVSHLSH